MPCVSLDWLLEHYPPPDFVKIDIEGAEALALKGASKLISDVRPLFMCEVTDNQPVITELFRQHDYNLYDADNLNKGMVNTVCFNTLAVPREQLVAFLGE